LTTLTPVPESPRSRGEAFAEHVLGTFDLDEADQQVLEQVCRLLDRADALRTAIDADGVVITSARVIGGRIRRSARNGPPTLAGARIHTASRPPTATAGMSTESPSRTCTAWSATSSRQEARFAN